METRDNPGPRGIRGQSKKSKQVEQGQSHRLNQSVFVLTGFALGAFWLGSDLAHAQVLQLPSVRTFSYSGGVLVPDRGTASLGGVSSYASGGSSRRWNPAMGNSTRAGGASVSVTIIDHNEMDRQLLGDADPPRTAFGNQIRHQHDELTDAKTLVRNARVLLKRGERSRARGVYELAILRLSRLVNASRTRRTDSTAVAPKDDPDYLLAYAQAEFARAYPEVSH